MRNLYIVGFMASGKSTVGELAARLAGVSFADLDQVIVQQQGRTIPEIFAEAGEAGFRRCEQQALRSVAGRGMIIATGGGILTWPGNAQLMEEEGSILWLERPLDRILGELDPEDRPMAAGGEQRVTALYEERLPQYREAAQYRVLNDGDPLQAAREVALRAGEVLLG